MTNVQGSVLFKALGNEPIYFMVPKGLVKINVSFPRAY